MPECIDKLPNIAYIRSPNCSVAYLEAFLPVNDGGDGVDVAALIKLF